MQTRTRTSSRRFVAPIVALATALVATGCLTLTSGRNYAIGFETNRANLVVHTAASKALYDLGKAAGSQAARDALLQGTPDRIPISAAQRIAICGVSAFLCLSADQIGRTLVGWFRSDIRNRSDFWEAVSAAGRDRRCFAWTFVPRRNLTHKGLGTSGCRVGVVR